MIFTTLSELTRDCEVPYAVFIHDLLHLRAGEFPETLVHGSYEAYEELHERALRDAAFVMTESEQGKTDVLSHYGHTGITADRVTVVPYVPYLDLPILCRTQSGTNPVLSIQLPRRYVYYPAQFWPHKNHVRLVEAIGVLRRQSRVDVALVLSGHDRGGPESDLRTATLSQIRNRSAALGVDDLVHYVGYLSDEETARVYLGATALVMPTFAGPSNLPILEAWAIGCPAITSDIAGLREQAADAALLLDPTSVESIAAAIGVVWSGASIAADLVERGHRRLAMVRSESSRAIELVVRRAMDWADG